MNIRLLSPFIFALFLFKYSNSSLWSETGRMSDMQQWRLLCSHYQVAQAYMEDVNARITIFAPVNDVFLYNPDLRAMDQKEVLSHIVDTQVNELNSGRRWEKQTLIRSTINSGYIYITQFENPGPPGNFSYFANAGTICNHVSNQWGIITGEQYLYKVCTPMGHRPYPGTALGFVRDDENAIFVDRHYDNRDLTELRNILDRVPDIALVIYGSSAWNGFHTFFLPTNKAFAKVIDRNRVDREVLLAHVSGMNRVLFTYPWLYDGGIHFYPSIRFSSNIIEDNYKLKLSLRNITDHRTGKWDLYIVTSIYERYGEFRRGAVWAKILVPNIPVQNGVVHIIDNVLGIVTNTIDQMLMDNYRCTTLMRFMATIGQIVRNYMSATGGLVTFFAPWNEAFERIPEPIERRLLRDRIWLEQILKLHIIPAKELVTEEITNDTIIATVDNMRHLYFSKTEWPKNNITYYVIGGGIRTAIQMEDVTATNGIIHYIDRVLGVPYQSLWEVLRNETRAQRSMEMLNNLQLKYSLDPWQVLTPEQNMTFFVPIDEAWDRVSPAMKNKLLDGNHWQALQYVYKRHILQGQALMYTDLRERTYVMMNDEKVIIRRRGRYFELYWPRGNRVARIIEGGEIAGINGFMHLIDGVLIYEPDIRAGSKNVLINSQLLLILMFLILFDSTNIYTTRKYIWFLMLDVIIVASVAFLIICSLLFGVVIYVCNQTKVHIKSTIYSELEFGNKTTKNTSHLIESNYFENNQSSSKENPKSSKSTDSIITMKGFDEYMIEERQKTGFILFKSLFAEDNISFEEYKLSLDDQCLDCKFSTMFSNNIQSYSDKKSVARHESGHACMAVENKHQVKEVSIVRTSEYVGVTRWYRKNNNCSKSEMISRLQIAAAGPASDKVFYKDSFAGSAHDQIQLKITAFQMVAKFGMGRQGAIGVFPQISEEEKREVAKEVKFLIEQVVSHANKRSEANMLLMDALSDELIEKGTITGDELTTFVDNFKQKQKEQKEKEQNELKEKSNKIV